MNKFLVLLLVMTTACNEGERAEHIAKRNDQMYIDALRIAKNNDPKLLNAFRDEDIYGVYISGEIYECVSFRSNMKGPFDRPLPTYCFSKNGDLPLLKL